MAAHFVLIRSRSHYDLKPSIENACGIQISDTLISQSNERAFNLKANFGKVIVVTLNGRIYNPVTLLWFFVNFFNL